MALILGVLTKYLPLILLPAQVIYLWRTRQRRPPKILPFTLLVTGGLALMALIIQPLWAGLETFRGVRGVAHPGVVASTAGLLTGVLSLAYSSTEASLVTTVALGSLFGVFLLIVSWRVRDTSGFLAACASIALAYLLIASPVYWAWYAAFPLSLMALSPDGAFRWMAPVLSLCSRLVAPIDDIAANGFTDWKVLVVVTTTIGVALPLVIWLALSVQQWRKDGVAALAGR
jgi:hypothetical protein